jgi:hypothetical protein
MNSVNYLIGAENITIYPLQPFDDTVCDFLDKLSKRLMNDKAKKYPDVIALAFWMRRGNIQNLKMQCATNTTRVGRGLVFHITPSNIPVNFAFSWLFGVLSGNANIVRIPSKPFPQVNIICDAITEELFKFPEMRDRMAFISYPADDETTALLCLQADARLIWGGDKTVGHIRLFKTKPRCVDVVFPDRYSICIINGKAVLEADDQEMIRLSNAFYNDTYLMDQNACSSPQLILWQNACDSAQERFWNAIATLANQKYAIQPVIAMDKYIQFCIDSIKHNNIMSIIRNRNILYRATLSSLHGDDLTNFRGIGGYFYEYDLKSLEEFIPFITEKYQTVTYYGIQSTLIKNIILKYHLSGIDRIVPIGQAMDINIIWDGYDLINMLTRTIIDKGE